MSHYKKYGLFFLIVLLDLALSLINPTLAEVSIKNSMEFILEVLAIVPPVMVLMGLLDVWVPRKLVENNLGPNSGIRGSGLAILLGTAAAGPLYAAFPLAVSLRNKGARMANIAIFLGSWATIKIPMILMESSFIGIRFALLRLAFTIPGVLCVGYLMEWMVPVSTVESDPAPGENTQEGSITDTMSPGATG